MVNNLIMAFPSTLIINYIYLGPLRTTKEIFQCETIRNNYLITIIGVFVFSWLGRGIQDPTIKEAEGKHLR